MASMFPQTNVHYMVADFTRPLDLPPLDGIVIANALHYVRQKEPVLQMLRSYLKPGARLILVEYNDDRGNPWVPYPLSYPTWQTLSARCGLTSPACWPACPVAISTKSIPRSASMVDGCELRVAS